MLTKVKRKILGTQYYFHCKEIRRKTILIKSINDYKIMNRLKYGCLAKKNGQYFMIKMLNPFNAFYNIKTRARYDYNIEKMSFQNEYNILKRFNEPNIIKIYEYGYIDNKIMINMLTLFMKNHNMIRNLRLYYKIYEYIEGDNLALLMKRNQIEKKNYIPLAIEICKALNIIHSKNVIHLDFKPSNIVVTKNNKVKIIDFEFSRIENEIPNKYFYKINPFTIKYAAPEQFLPKQILTKKTDIYLLGIILYELFTGTNFWEDVINPYKCITHPKKINPSIPSILSDMIINCLQFKQENRKVQIENLIKELEIVFNKKF
ncbi:MAG: serine/threonine-protein kinase [Candidatus Hodarchaeota archaeon]